MTPDCNRPDWDVNLCLIQPGSSTFTTAMPDPTSSVPSRMDGRPGPTRNSAPRKISPRQPRITVSRLRKRVNQGATGAKTPKHSRGMVVSRLTVVALTLSSC
jgi:hypothetical protein